MADAYAANAANIRILNAARTESILGVPARVFIIRQWHNANADWDNESPALWIDATYGDTIRSSCHKCSWDAGEAEIERMIDFLCELRISHHG